MRWIAAATALSTVCSVARPAAPAPLAPIALLDFAVKLADDRVVRIADYRGRWLLVNYWATWCSTCLAEMPVLSRLADREPRLAVLGLTDETLGAEALSGFLATHPVSYAVASVDRSALPEALPATAFGIGMRPISYLIAPDGTVVERFLGAIDVKAVERRIDAAPR